MFLHLNILIRETWKNDIILKFLITFRGDVTAVIISKMFGQLITCYADEPRQNTSHKDWNVQLVFKANITEREKN